MRQQVHEFVCRLDGCLVVLRSTHHDARRVEIVGQRVPLAEKFRGEEDVVVMQSIA